MRADEQRAFEQAFAAHFQGVFRLLYRVTGARDEAEDLAQEAFVRLYRRGAASLGEEGLRPWLYRVALNLASNAARGHRRRERREDAVVHDPALAGTTGDDPAAQVEVRAERALVRRALATLPERQARLLMLRHGGLSYREVAECLGIAPTSVGTLLVRAEGTFEAAYRELTGTTEAEVDDD